MSIKKIISNLLESNTFIIEKNNSIIIVDCGCDLQKVKKEVGNKKVLAIFLTHGHFDHSAYCNDYAKEFSCQIYTSENIKTTLSDKIAIYSEDYSTIEDFSNFKFVKDGEVVDLGDFQVKCYEFQGHSPCCMGYIVEKNLFAGDFVFAKSFGRVDLKNGNKNQMIFSLDKLKGLDFTKIYSGHGEESNKNDFLYHVDVFKKFLSR